MSLGDLELLHRLVAIPSVTGSEAEAVRFMREQARADGLRVLDDAAGNFIAEAGRGPRLLLFVGHIDTVPGHIAVRVEQGGAQGRGTLWGRGSVDAKGPLAAAYCAARRLRDSQDVTVRIVGAVDEEGNSKGVKALPRDWSPDWIVIGEPSGVHGLTLGYKGIVRGHFRLDRPRHHGAHPGPTGVEAGIAFWHACAGAFAFADRFESMQGHLNALETQSDGLVDQVTGRFNLRLPPGIEPEGVQARLAELGAQHGATVHVDETVPPALASKRTPLVAAFLRAIRESGGEPRFLRKTGTCDFNPLARRYPSVPIAAYGPGDARLDHTPEERIELAEFEESVRVLESVFRSLAEVPAVAASPLPA